MAIEQEQNKKAKKKVHVKSKLSKPNPKQKQQPYSIEISADAVKVIRVDAKGKIIGSGFSPLKGIPLWADKAWINRLSQSVKEASREARVPKGSNFPCSVVASGSQIVLQRFTWPQMAHQAMLNNARHEMASYLPGNLSSFIIGAEVQGKNKAKDEKVPTMDVFVAAIPKDMATAISSAVTWAGFKVICLDVSENVSFRLVNRCSVIEGGVPQSYGVLDLSNTQPNITLYLNGFFYSTHYFEGAKNQQGKPQGASIDEIEALMGLLENIKGSSSDKKLVVTHDVEAILNEVSVILDFIKYQERGSNLECILIKGRLQSGFAERLSSGLDMPVYTTDVWVRQGILENAKGDLGFYLDTYASGLPSLIISRQHMLDLKTDVLVRKPGRRLAIIATASVLVMLLALAGGVFILFNAERNAQREYNALIVEEMRVNTIVNNAPSVAQIETRRKRVDFYGTRLMGIYGFYAEFAQAGVLIPIIFETPFTEISSVRVLQDTINVSITARYFNHVADLLEELRDNPLFLAASTTAVAESDTFDWETGSTTWNTTITMHRGMGADFDD